MLIRNEKSTKRISIENIDQPNADYDKNQNKEIKIEDTDNLVATGILSNRAVKSQYINSFGNHEVPSV